MPPHFPPPCPDQPPARPVPADAASLPRAPVRLIRLSAADQARVAAAVLNPASLTPALARAIAQYSRRRRDAMAEPAPTDD